ncbi:MAG TPA: XRE family transcriptional regulator [Ktedonobacteraceae bacterium]
MSTLRDLREQAGLSLSELARLANIDFKTAKKADSGGSVQRLKALALLSVIGSRLGREIRIEDVEGLETF